MEAQACSPSLLSMRQAAAGALQSVPSQCALPLCRLSALRPAYPVHSLVRAACLGSRGMRAIEECEHLLLAHGTERSVMHAVLRHHTIDAWAAWAEHRLIWTPPPLRAGMLQEEILASCSGSTAPTPDEVATSQWYQVQVSHGRHDCMTNSNDAQSSPSMPRPHAMLTRASPVLPRVLRDQQGACASEQGCMQHT